MVHSLAIQSTLRALILLIFTSFVQMTIIDIPYSDERVQLNPKTDWGYWTYYGTASCPGIWTSKPNETHTISLDFTGVGITVHGYADPYLAPWEFQIDDGPPESLSVEPKTTCKVIKDRQGLTNGNHRVTVTPRVTSFVLTKFSVTQTAVGKRLTTAEIFGIAIGSSVFVLAVPGVYLLFKRCATNQGEMKV